MFLLIVSICKDEAKTIGEVLDRIPARISGVDTIEKWVIDDGSTDDTVKIAKKHGAKVISDGAHKKLAARFGEALELALSRGADVLVNVDGDLQFDPGEIPKLIDPIIKDEADFVAADRFTDVKSGRRHRPKGMPLSKYMSNKLGAWVVGQLSGQRFRDVTCGFRAYGRKAIISLNINTTYTYTQESFQVLAFKKLRIVAVPVSIKYYPGRKSRVVKSFLQFLFGSAINILRAFRDYAPLKFFGLLGLVLFIPGVFMGGFTLVHWLTTGAVTPYVTVGFIGLYLFSGGLMLWALGLVADMFDRMLNNQEKIIERLKTETHDKKED
ncbi:MAG TPA: glycosyltransferase family 2 protein [Candidatus Saccharimonadales bacterium]|nr:glycosyltransferase family 2 protein [Candidatus Saccharimonadales bacterium]